MNRMYLLHDICMVLDFNFNKVINFDALIKLQIVQFVKC